MFFFYFDVMFLEMDDGCVFQSGQSDETDSERFVAVFKECHT